MPARSIRVIGLGIPAVSFGASARLVSALRQPPLCARLFAALDGELLATIISDDVAIAVTLAAKRHRDFCFFHHRTHIAENGDDFCALSNSLVALVAMVVGAVALLGQQQIEIVDLDLC